MNWMLTKWLRVTLREILLTKSVFINKTNEKNELQYTLTSTWPYFTKCALNVSPASQDRHWASSSNVQWLSRRDPDHHSLPECDQWLRLSVLQYWPENPDTLSPLSVPKEKSPTDWDLESMKPTQNRTIVEVGCEPLQRFFRRVGSCSILHQPVWLDVPYSALKTIFELI